MQPIVAPPWRSRGYLPHFDGPEVVQHVTFRLADSLPLSLLPSMRHEKLSPSRPNDATDRRARFDEWLDRGYGRCLLQDPTGAACVQRSLCFGDGVRYRLFAWVIMPNHVHILLQPAPEWPLSRIVAGWKTYTGRRLATLPGARKPVWQREYWDRFIRNARHFGMAQAYIEQNPVHAGLVDRPEDWAWSSAAMRFSPKGEDGPERGR